MFNKFVNWLVVSSANPEQYSLTLQGTLMAGAGQVVADLQNLGLNVGISQYTNEVGHAVAIVGLLLAAVGFARKVFLTATNGQASGGKNLG